MSKPLIVHKGRTNIVTVSLGTDVSLDNFFSEIREQPNVEADLIATWDIAFDTDGTDGELILTLDDSITSEIKASKGYMDLKRVTNDEPISVFDNPIKVEFKSVITA